MLRSPAFDVPPEPDLAHVEAGDGLGEPVGADELLDPLTAEVAEEPGYLGRPQKIFRAGAASHLTNDERVCERKQVVKRLAGR